MGHRARGRANDTGRRRSPLTTLCVSAAAMGDLRWLRLTNECNLSVFLCHVLNGSHSGCRFCIRGTMS